MRRSISTASSARAIIRRGGRNCVKQSDCQPRPYPRPPTSTIPAATSDEAGLPHDLGGRPEARSKPRSPTCLDGEIISVVVAPALQCPDQGMSTVGPCSAAEFGTDLRLSRGQITMVNERPLDLCQRV